MITFELAEVAIFCDLFRRILAAIHPAAGGNMATHLAELSRTTRRRSEGCCAALACQGPWFDHFGSAFHLLTTSNSCFGVRDCVRHIVYHGVNSQSCADTTLLWDAQKIGTS
jgi:hypothetical protein